MKIDYTKKSVKEVIKNPSFWRRVKKEYVEDNDVYFLCSASQDFHFFWKDEEFRQQMLNKAEKFAKSTAGISFDSDRDSNTLGLYYDNESDVYSPPPLRKARLEFLDWMIKNTSKK